jgi:hypothetical protein
VLAPASLQFIKDNNPGGAGAASRLVYDWLALGNFPLEVRQGLQKCGDSIFFLHPALDGGGGGGSGKKMVIHTAIPVILKDTPRGEAVASISTAISNTFTQFVDIAVAKNGSNSLRLSPFWTDSGPYQPEVAAMMFEALAQAVANLKPAALAVLSLVTVELFIFNEAEVFSFEQAGFVKKKEMQIPISLSPSHSRAIYRSPNAYFDWLRDAADGDNVEANVALAKFLFNEGSLGEAAHYAVIAADQGFGPGMHEMALICKVNGDFTGAYQWFSKAVVAGHTKSIKFAAECCEHGNGVIRDLNEAMRFYEIGSRRGCVDCMVAQAELLLPRNGGCMKVLELLRSAMSKGHHRAKTLLESLGAAPHRQSFIPTPKTTRKPSTRAPPTSPVSSSKSPSPPLAVSKTEATPALLPEPIAKKLTVRFCDASIPTPKTTNKALTRALPTSPVSKSKSLSPPLAAAAAEATSAPLSEPLEKKPTVRFDASSQKKRLFDDEDAVIDESQTTSEFLNCSSVSLNLLDNLSEVS